MVEWNRIFQLFLFSGILGQACEVHLKFRNEIPENVLSIRSSPGISIIFGRMERAPYQQKGVQSELLYLIRFP